MTIAAPAQPSILNAPDYARPSSELVERFRDVPAANIGDAQERLWVMHGNIGPMWAGARCVGPALPLYTQAGDNLVIHRALETAKPGDVLVVNGQGDETRALIGGLIAVRSSRSSRPAPTASPATLCSAFLSMIRDYAPGFPPHATGSDLASSDLRWALTRVEKQSLAAVCAINIRRR